MRISYVIIATVVALQSSQAFAQGEGAPLIDRKGTPLTLRTRIPLPGVYGRMDHFGWDSKRGLLIVSALGNDTVEIIGDWKRRNTIAGLEHPQAAVYIPGVDRIAVSSQSGKLRFYDAASYVLVRTLDFGNEALQAAEKGLKRLWEAYETLMKMNAADFPATGADPLANC